MKKNLDVLENSGINLSLNVFLTISLLIHWHFPCQVAGRWSLNLVTSASIRYLYSHILWNIYMTAHTHCKYVSVIISKCLTYLLPASERYQLPMFIVLFHLCFDQIFHEICTEPLSSTGEIRFSRTELGFSVIPAKDASGSPSFHFPLAATEMSLLYLLMNCSSILVSIWNLFL